ncbi:sulfatase [Cohnella sp. CIP 111063]|uniref:sulfatase-like hydrolase/transferase n=1 Tax=unclassified Cohnella TaxID=2636738 RepID=UPI000B8C67DF|nr:MULTISPECIES: sulfatase-like hydrolase/transferase [unclassified Cohnella]OXS55820.1 sulfatase [Cohnella sp. CIP 111063]PRX67017.1 arylsulfatase A-like enzyme [Cohnella sp. SGD-V74]
MQSSADRPNILWISLEDTSPRFGCYGDSLARTPHIDRLAEEGTMFPNAFAVAGVCSPSRSAVITGMYPTSIGTHHMRTEHTNPHTPELPTPYSAVPPAHVKTFTEYLRAEDYFCTNNWKTDYQFASPLTAWDEDGMDAHWRHRDPEQPFFAVFNHILTHESGMWGDMIRKWMNPNAADEPRPLVTDPDKVKVPPYLPDTPKSREALARYYDLIAEADEYVGRLLGQLEEDGLADNTIVILWSDHGEGLPRAKRWPYDAGIRVPLLVRWPGKVPPGAVDDRLVSLIDLGPTALSLAGVPIPRHLAGQPFLGPDERPRDYVYATRDRYDEAYDKVRAVRDKRFKYIRNDYPNQPYLQWIPFSHHHPMFQELWRLELADELKDEQRLLLRGTRPAEELYDCGEDPYEIRNLAADPAYRDTLERLRGELDVWCGKYDVWGDVPEERMVAEMRPGGVQPQAAAPIFVPINGSRPGVEPSAQGEYEEPTAIMLHAATQGASIAYTTEEGEKPRWRLYTGPIPLREGSVFIRAKAVRIGYKDSEEAQASYTVRLATP